MSVELVNMTTGEIVEHEEPSEFLGRARQMAVLLTEVVRQQGLSVDIQGKKYLKLEAWQFLAGMAQLTPRTRELVEIKDEINKTIGFRVYVELVRDADGLVIGGAYGRCDLNERIARSGAFAAESMATTRATNKAISQKLRFVPVLAGYVGTPAEEMTEVPVTRNPPATKPPKWAQKSDDELPPIDEEMDAAFDAVAVKGKQDPPSEVAAEVPQKTTETQAPSGQGGRRSSTTSEGSLPGWVDDRLPMPKFGNRNWRWLIRGDEKTPPAQPGGDRHAYVLNLLDMPNLDKRNRERCNYALLVMEGKA